MASASDASKVSPSVLAGSLRGDAVKKRVHHNVPLEKIHIWEDPVARQMRQMRGRIGGWMGCKRYCGHDTGTRVPNGRESAWELGHGGAEEAVRDPAKGGWAQVRSRLVVPDLEKLQY